MYIKQPSDQLALFPDNISNISLQIYRSISLQSFVLTVIFSHVICDLSIL